MGIFGKLANDIPSDLAVRLGWKKSMIFADALSDVIDPMTVDQTGCFVQPSYPIWGNGCTGYTECPRWAIHNPKICHIYQNGNGRWYVILFAHFHWKRVGERLMEIEESIRHLVQMCRNEDIHITLACDFNNEKFIEFFKDIQLKSLIPKSVTANDSQGHIIGVYTTDWDAEQIQSDGPSHKVPKEWTKEFRGKMRRIMAFHALQERRSKFRIGRTSQISDEMDKLVSYIENRRAVTKARLIALLEEVGLAADTALLIDHIPPFYWSQGGETHCFTPLLGMNGKKPQLAFYPLFGYFVKHVVDTIPELGLTKDSLNAHLTKLLWEKVLKCDPPDEDASQFYSTVPGENESDPYKMCILKFFLDRGAHQLGRLN